MLSLPHNTTLGKYFINIFISYWNKYRDKILNEKKINKNGWKIKEGKEGGASHRLHSANRLCQDVHFINSLSKPKCCGILIVLHKTKVYQKMHRKNKHKKTPASLWCIIGTTTILIHASKLFWSECQLIQGTHKVVRWNIPQACACWSHPCDICKLQVYHSLLIQESDWA